MNKTKQNKKLLTFEYCVNILLHWFTLFYIDIFSLTFIVATALICLPLALAPSQQH